MFFNCKMKRILDLFLAIFLFLILIIPLLLIVVAIYFTSKGPIIYWSDRIGRHNKVFKMPKFRTMNAGTPALATHLLNNPDNYLTPIGAFLRRTSLDELPQIYSVFKDQMSFIGPRPALYNQKDLITLRMERGVSRLLPGITGWAQVNGRDKLSLSDKVKLDEYYLCNQSIFLDLKILWMTLLIVLNQKGVTH
jgi:O-antigen biosynthesis protein WbqP